MAKVKKTSVDRRDFLKSAVGSAAALVAGAQQSEASSPANPQAPQAADTAVAEEVLTTDRPGSDFMVDILKALGIEYICANPGSSFRALHESVLNHGANKNPELITCCHEESAVGMAHGYAKIEGKPMGVFLHGTVGLQHASMAVFNAFCDRVPVYLMVGNTMDATMRRPGAEWVHCAQDMAAMVRDYVKWDDQPASLPHFAESAVRAYKIAMTTPTAPVLLSVDSELQENPMPPGRLRIPKLTLTAPPQGDSGAIAEAARLLVGAQNPVLVADRAARTAAGMALLVELAETLQAPVIDQVGRMNFPTRHPLNHTERRRTLIADADVILGLELADFWGVVNSFHDQLQRASRSVAAAGVKLISIGTRDLYIKSNFQDFQRFPEVDLAIAADAEATLPELIEASKRLLTSDRRRTLQERGVRLANAHRQAWERARGDAAYGWDASPISTARLSAELWEQIKDQDWSLVSESQFVSRWPLRLWYFYNHFQFIGGAGGAGVGYGAPAAAGAALANRKQGRLSVNIQNDGDLMYGPGVLWTAAHHRIPLLSIMHNNRAYHQEVMHLQRMANRHNRGVTSANLGTTLADPDIDFAKLAQSMGVHAEGPITDPKDLGPAIARAVDLVRRGEPALVDVVTQPR